MSVPAEFITSTEHDSETRPVLGPAGNRVRVSEFLEPKRKKETLKKPQQTRRLGNRLPESILRANASVDSSCSSDSSSSVSSLKKVNLRKTRTMEQKGLKSVKVVPEKVEVPSLSRSPSPAPSPSPAFFMKRCDWITANSGK